LLRALAARPPEEEPLALAAIFGAIAFPASRKWREKGSSGPEVMAARSTPTPTS
jgi:hypothetical protein